MTLLRTQVRNVYDEPQPDDGLRVLVDRLCTRGMREADPRMSRWCKQVSPTLERLRAGHCIDCLVTADLEQILKPHTPPDMRIKRLITELAAVPRGRALAEAA